MLTALPHVGQWVAVCCRLDLRQITDAADAAELWDLSEEVGVGEGPFDTLEEALRALPTVGEG